MPTDFVGASYENSTTSERSPACRPFCRPEIFRDARRVHGGHGDGLAQADVYDPHQVFDSMIREGALAARRSPPKKVILAGRSAVAACRVTSTSPNL